MKGFNSSLHAVDWGRHFRQVSNSRVTESVFGTINSEHTIHELSDLLNALQSQVDTMQQTYNNGKDAWQQSDFTNFGHWEQDWNTFLARWNPVADWTKARVNGVKSSGKSTEYMSSVASLVLHPIVALGTSPDPWDVVTDEPAYQHLLTSFKAYDGEPTSFPELDRRWKGTPPSYRVPQPTAPDADLNVYKGSDKVLKDVLGIMPNLPNPLKMPLWEKIAIGVGALVSLGIVIRISTGRIL